MDATLSVRVSDPDGGRVDVTFLGREAPPSDPPFTLVVLPDTQYYSAYYPHIFTEQTQWIVDSRDDLNTVFVTHVGDIVEFRDTCEQHWINALESMSVLDDVVPYGIALGNHDTSHWGDSIYYDKYFSRSRYQGIPWYGCGYRNNKNSYQLFSAGSYDFLILHLEWEPTDNVVDWAAEILDAFPDRRAILSTHKYLNDQGERADDQAHKRPFGNTGEDLWQKLVRDHCSIFLVLNGHYHWWPGYGEARLTSINDCGSEVHQVLQNYQNEPSGGGGWLRYYTFEPARNAIEAYTYSPVVDSFQDDEASRFTLDYPMGTEPFELLAVNENVWSDSTTGTPWPDLSYLTGYEWYVDVDDGECLTTGPVWRFTTEQDCSSPPSRDSSCNGIDEDCDGSADEDFSSSPTECGLGECAGNTGQSRCDNGVPGDTCDPHAGATVETCDGLDNDCDGAIDEDFPSPSRVFWLRFESRTEMEWSSMVVGDRFDVVKGDLGQLRATGGDFGASILGCLEDDGTDAIATDEVVPEPSGGFFYLVRAQLTCKSGTCCAEGIGERAGRDEGIALSPLTCP